MPHHSDQFNESEYDFDDTLPSDHRSGFVAVIGRPNVGKSTLMNHFLGQKIAIVSNKPQTTRNQLLGILTLPDDSYPNITPAQVIFVDTPGIHNPKHKLGEVLVDTALDALPEADVIVWLVDATEAPTPEDGLVAEAIQTVQTQRSRYGDPPAPVLLGLNKVDLLPQEHSDIAQNFLDLYPTSHWLTLSAIHGHNRTELLQQIIEQLPPGPRYYPADQITDQQTRFIVAELIREAVLHSLHQEVPHAVAVYVTEFTRRNDNLTYISANIVVERKSQKGIVIGDKGKTLKRIGRKARPKIENLIDTKVYLDLWVKLRPKWRTKENELRWLGYVKPNWVIRVCRVVKSYKPHKLYKLHKPYEPHKPYKLIKS